MRRKSVCLCGYIRLIVNSLILKVKDLLKRENNNFDLLRIICASAVMIGHSYRLNPVSGEDDIVYRLLGFTYSSALAVKVFFCISGLLVTDSIMRRRSMLAFAVSRIFRVFPALLFVVVVTAFIIGPLVSILPAKEYFRNSQVYMYVFMNMLMHTQHFLPGVFETLPWAHYVNSPLWTLRIEVKCYLGLLLFYFFTGPRKWLLNAVAGIIILDAVFHLGYIGVSHTTELSLLPFSFALGMILALNKEFININGYLVLTCILATAAVWQVQHINEIMFITSFCMLLLWLSGFAVVRKLEIRYDISYGVYVWGFVVQQIVYMVVGTQNIYLYMLECLFITYIIAWLSFILVEQRAIGIGQRLNKRIRSTFDGVIGILLVRVNDKGDK